MANRYRRYASLLLGAAVTIYACADLDVLNLNEPDRERVLSSFDDAVALVAGSYNTWYHGVFDYGGPGLFLSQASFQHSSPWACSTEVYSRIPRMAFRNDASDPYYSTISRVWIQSYAAIAAVTDGLRAFSDPDVQGQGSEKELARARVFGRFSLGLSHATVALLYDRGFRMDETVDPGATPEAMGYEALMQLALGDFDEVIRSVGNGPPFSLPYGWMQAEVSSDDLARVAHSYRARFRAQVARTPAEREAVDWIAVLADVDAGLQEDHLMEMDWDAGWYNGILEYSTWPSWHNLNYFLYGMADQSGRYQEWLQVPFHDKTHLLPDGRPVLIVTPDLRFPQGGTVPEQRAETGRYFHIVSETEAGDTWKRPDRGSWRWSWYKAGPLSADYGSEGQMIQPLFRFAEMRLLRAEALYRLGDRAGAAAIVNETRAEAGLSTTDASGSNASCVPRLPDRSCGDLWEMLKWEKRMETVWTGVAGANWWFDGRGWGDLWRDTPLQLPVPCEELRVMGEAGCNTYGGPGGEMGSPGSSYGFPGESSEIPGMLSSEPSLVSAALPAGCDGPRIVR